ncbi:hypothetical protein M9458_042790 [Cirrhinus mrigala]|uniref:Uncharacterized protein n=1 Tax=Cirrhinus mrigala TaxID=683832 RepID=A0ABD0NN59_CIRMR
MAFLNLLFSSDSQHTLIIVSLPPFPPSTSSFLFSFLGCSSFPSIPAQLRQRPPLCPPFLFLLLIFLLLLLSGRGSSDSSSAEGAVLERSPSPGLSALLPGLG